MALHIINGHTGDLKRPGSSGNPDETRDSAGDPANSGIQEPAAIEEANEYEMMRAGLEDFEIENIKVRDAMKNFKFPEQ